jgi:ABC-2 type transport system permease protein
MFPSTHGIQGYIKINSMGADIHKVSFEYLSLWIQTALYFLTASLTYTWQMRKRNSAETQIEDAMLPTNN